MLVWFHNFSDGALDSIKSFTTKARQTIRVKGYTKKLIRLDDGSTMNDNEANVRIYLCISYIDFNLS